MTTDELHVFTYCLFAGICGGLAHYVQRRDDWEGYPVVESGLMPITRAIGLILGRSLIGFFAGGFIYLILIGGIKSDWYSYCRLIAVAFAAGYSGPSFLTRHLPRLAESAVDEKGKTA